MSNTSCHCCISLRSASMMCACITLLYALAMITASAVTIFKDGSSLSPFVLTAFEIKGIADFVSSVLCIRGICTESCNYLLPWIFTISVGTVFTFLVAISYMMYETTSYTIFGVILFSIAMLFSVCWICVLSYYYQLYDKNNRRTARNRPRQTRGNATRINRGSSVVGGEISATSFSVVSDEYVTPPPAYNVVFKNAAFQLNDENDKLPSYEEAIVTECGNESADGRRY